METQVVDQEEIDLSIEENTTTQFNPPSDQQESMEMNSNKSDESSNNAELDDILNQINDADVNNQHDTDHLFIDPGEKESVDDEYYDPSISIAIRIEVATQRFKDTRRVSSTRNQILSSYLNFGEVKIGQDLNISSKKSTDSIQDEELIVDFTYVVKAYLSSYIIDQSGYYELEHFYEAPIVISSFLNYLFRHDVCPEYSEDILSAIKIADHAKIELPNCKNFIMIAFNKFNKACSILYDGSLHGTFDNPWDLKASIESIKITLSEAKEIINGVFGENALENIKHVKASTRKALQVEIINIEDSPVKYLKNSKNKDSPNNVSNNMEQNDISDSSDDDIRLYKMTVRTCKEPIVESFDIHIELEILQYAMVGMLIIADFHQLSNGWWYYDTVINVYPSYYEMCEDSDCDE